MGMLTASAVGNVVRDCLFEQSDLIDGKPPEGRLVEADAIVNRMGFDRVRLDANRGVVAELLMQLPDEFMQTKGGGMSFLNACYDRNGNHWGEHRDMGLLFAIGEACGLSRCLLPREMWSALPGGMPYYGVDDEACRTAMQTVEV